METNQLFKELRTNPSAVTGYLNQDMKNAAMRGTQALHGVNSSVYMGSSVHMHSENQNDGRSQNAVSRIADDFLDGLASEMGVKHQPLSYGHYS